VPWPEAAPDTWYRKLCSGRSASAFLGGVAAIPTSAAIVLKRAPVSPWSRPTPLRGGPRAPQQYSIAFGLNSLGFTVFGYVGGRLAERWSEKGTLVVGLAMCALGAGGLLATAVLHLPLIAIIVSLLTMVSGVAVPSSPATSLALAAYAVTIRRAATSTPQRSPRTTAQDLPDTAARLT